MTLPATELKEPYFEISSFQKTVRSKGIDLAMAITVFILAMIAVLTACGFFNFLTAANATYVAFAGLSLAFILSVIEGIKCALFYTTRITPIQYEELEVIHEAEKPFFEKLKSTGSWSEQELSEIGLYMHFIPNDPGFKSDPLGYLNNSETRILAHKPTTPLELKEQKELRAVHLFFAEYFASRSDRLN